MKSEPFHFTRRLFVLGCLKTGLVTTLLGRLYYLQILKGSHYKDLSFKNHLQSTLIEPSRGLILDKNGYVLASHKVSYKVYLSPDLAKSSLHTLDYLHQLLNFSDYDLNLLKNRLQLFRRKKILLKEDLSFEELSKIELHIQNLPGILVEKGEKRYYPYPELMGHVVGYVGAVSLKEQEDSVDPLLSLPGFRIGKTGIERSHNQLLQGDAGIKQTIVDAYGREKKTLSVMQATPGETIRLTIDLPLQKKVRELLSVHQSGACVVMRIDTGAIEALVSHPSYNTQLFTNSISKNVWQEVSQNPFYPLVNKVTQGLYAPGSIFKLIMGIAGLEEGVVHQRNTVYCPGFFDLNGHRFHCWSWKYGGHGTMTLQSAIAQSCDVFFYEMAQKLGIDKMMHYAHLFGLGTPTGIEISHEKGGFLPNKEWKKRVKKTAWTLGDTINASIGQGYLLTTPLQQAKLTAMLGNGFIPIRPHLVMDQKNKVDESPPALRVKPEHVRLILDGMHDVVYHPNGTAFASRLQDPCCSMMGKTASTQVSRITQQQRLEGTHNDRTYFFREHAMFVALVPALNPTHVISVIIEHGGGGAKVAAPIARDIAHFLQTHHHKTEPAL